MTLSIAIPSFIKDLLCITGPIFFLLMQFSALVTAYGVYKKKSSGSLSSIPFLSLLCNCSIWTIYASLKHDETLFFPNFIGIFVGYICSITFHMNSREGIPKYYLVTVGSLLVIALGLGYFDCYSSLGLLGLCLTVILMGSPLATLKTVILEQSTESLPFLYSLMTWLNSLSWSLYGLIDSRDANVYIPNLIGFALASVQLFLFVIFGFPDNDKGLFIDSNEAPHKLENFWYANI